jgi:hypothetical protein
LILFFCEKDKSVSFEMIYNKFPLEENGSWDKDKKNYFLNRGEIKFFFQLDYSKLEKSWGLEIALDDDNQTPILINYLSVKNVLPIQNPTPDLANNEQSIKELHFYTKKVINFSNNDL